MVRIISSSTHLSMLQLECSGEEEPGAPGNESSNKQRITYFFYSTEISINILFETPLSQDTGLSVIVSHLPL